ncbi:MAG: hypothetical protein AAGF19_01415 [Pseudomonadota bacterium]
MRALLTAFALSAALATQTPAFADADPGSASEIGLTWSEGLFYVPSGDKVLRGKIGKELSGIAPSSPVPAVVFMHGCDGISSVPKRSAKIYSEAGYAVFLPDSFARTNKPLSCNPLTAQGSLHREVLGWRHAEATHAVEQVRDLDWIQQDNVFLVGHSEGAITAATYEGPPVSARIVEGWTCHAGWPEYHGLKAPASEPVLSLVGELDPWFQLAVLKGHCGRFMNQDNGSRSVVYKRPHMLADKHYLIYNREARDVALGFLAEHMK